MLKALYKAKDMGGNNYFKYNEEMGKQEYLNLTTLKWIERSSNQWWILYYQPKIDIKTRRHNRYGSINSVEKLKS